MKTLRFETTAESTAYQHPATTGHEAAPGGLVYIYVSEANARQFVSETDADPSVLTDYIESQLFDTDVEAADFAESTEHLDALRDVFGAFEVWGGGKTLDVVLI